MSDKPELTRLARQLQRWGCRGTEEEIVELVESELRALSGGVAEGWKLVPVEPTEAMRRAGGECITPAWVNLNSHERKRYMLTVEAIWRDMLAAAPASPEGRGWVSVRERLPEKRATDYLVFVGGNDPKDLRYGWCAVAVYEPKKKRLKDWAWYLEPAGINPVAAGVTHWMQLPPAPTVAKEGA